MLRPVCLFIAVKTLREDFDGGDYGGFDGGGYGGGIGGYGGGADMLYKAFIQPFVDIGKTALAGIEDLTSKTQALAEILIQGIPTLFVPGLDAEYKKIKDAEKARADKIKQKYADVFERNTQAFLSTDAQGVAFLLAPAPFLAAKFFQKAGPPVSKATLDAILRTIDTLAASTNPVVELTNKVRSAAGIDQRPITREPDLLSKLFTHEESKLVYGTMLVEKDTGKQQQVSYTDLLKWLMNQQTIKDALANSDVLKSMQEDTKSMVSQTLMGIKKEIDQVLAAKTLADLSKIVGKDLGSAKLASVPPDQKQKVEAAAVTAAKKGAKQMYATKVKSEIASLKKQGVPSDNPYVKAYEKLLGMLA